MIKKFLQKTFKKISYSFFLKIYGNIKGSVKPDTKERIKVKNFDIEKNLNYKIYEIANGRLYTDRIHDTAIIIDNKIIEGPSFQLRYADESKMYNSKIEDNIVFTKGTPRILKNLKGSVLSLLTGGGGNNNYWHWLFDVLPRLGLCRNYIKLEDINYFLLPNLIRKFQNETLDFLNIPTQKRLSSEKFRHIKADKLIVTDHPFVVTGNATKDMMDMPKWISQWLKENFLIKNPNTNGKSIKKIYIDRNDDPSNKFPLRLISNENEVKEYLLENNFISIKLHETEFSEQIKLFNNAECIVGLHGGGFANIVFCKPKTKIIELKSTYAGTPIENLAKKNNLNYHSISIDAKPIHEYGFPNQQGSIEVPINKLTDILNS